jgi:hypothetical protein
MTTDVIHCTCCSQHTDNEEKAKRGIFECTGCSEKIYDTEDVFREWLDEHKAIYLFPRQRPALMPAPWRAGQKKIGKRPDFIISVPGQLPLAVEVKPTSTLYPLWIKQEEVRKLEIFASCFNMLTYIVFVQKESYVEAPVNYWVPLSKFSEPNMREGERTFDDGTYLTYELDGIEPIPRSKRFGFTQTLTKLGITQ